MWMQLPSLYCLNAWHILYTATDYPSSLPAELVARSRLGAHETANATPAAEARVLQGVARQAVALVGPPRHAELGTPTRPNGEGGRKSTQQNHKLRYHMHCTPQLQTSYCMQPSDIMLRSAEVQSLPTAGAVATLPLLVLLLLLLVHVCCCCSAAKHSSPSSSRPRTPKLLADKLRQDGSCGMQKPRSMLGPCRSSGSTLPWLDAVAAGCSWCLSALA